MALQGSPPLRFSDVITEFQNTLPDNRMSNLLGRGFPSMPLTPPFRLSDMLNVTYSRSVSTTRVTTATATRTTDASTTTLTSWIASTSFNTSYATTYQSGSRTTSRITEIPDTGGKTLSTSVTTAVFASRTTSHVTARNTTLTRNTTTLAGSRTTEYTTSANTAIIALQLY